MRFVSLIVCVSIAILVTCFSSAGDVAKNAPTEPIKVMKDFRVELIHKVPREKEGSWVNMCVDPKGRLIVSDQYGPLYRITPPALNADAKDTKIEEMSIPLGGAHGLLYFHDSLYVMVNEAVKVHGASPVRGLYRVRSSDGGETFEKPELLHALSGAGEHGLHAIVASPHDDKLYIVCGNDTKLSKDIARSLVPKLWGEDRLTPLVASYSTVMAPAGLIYRLDPDGKNLELFSCGMRNTFDIAFNRAGELFGYDSDMEYDINSPWYRPTRLFMATSGADFGFRNGSNNTPPRYPDTVPGIYDVGPGSPTGIVFGYGAKFPAKYQNALFMCDWSYGRMFVAHLTLNGASYKAELEEFLNGSPLPLTDVVINPKDGAMYFTVGGRRTQSALYRVTYVGKEAMPQNLNGDGGGTKAIPLVTRRMLELLHYQIEPRAVEIAWPYLADNDRNVRYAARVAIEHQDVKQWQDKALAETNPVAATQGLLALVRAVGQDPLTHPRKKSDAVPGVELRTPIFAALDRIDWAALNDTQRTDLLRVYMIAFDRLGMPEEAERDRFIKHYEPFFPTKSYELNSDLCQVLAFVQAPNVAERAVKLITSAPSHQEQIDYAKAIRLLDTGWTMDLRKAYFEWFRKAQTYKGGQQFAGAIEQIRKDAIATLTSQEKEELKGLIEAKVVARNTAIKPRPTVKQWKLDELIPVVEKGLTQPRDFDRGRQLFGEAKCFDCHHFDNEGGIQGPDLTQASGRYNVHDLLESIVEPSKVIADQYASMIFTLNNGKVLVGRVVNLQGDNMSVMTDMNEPNKLSKVAASEVESMETSKVSPMPAGLLDSFHEEEISDLAAYLLSRGDRTHKMFTK